MHALPITYTECEALFKKTAGSKSILFVSSTPGEGTSTLAYATAQRAAANGLRVLFMDFNTHRSFPRDVLCIEATSWSLSSPIPDGAFFHVPGGSLTILPAPVERAFELSSRQSSDVRSSLEGLSKTYDLIIGDSPSLTRLNGSGVTATSLAEAFENVIVVVSSAVTQRNTIQQALQKLEECGASVLGCVLNDRVNPDFRSEVNRQFNKMPMVGSWLRRLFMPLLDRLLLTDERF